MWNGDVYKWAVRVVGQKKREGGVGEEGKKDTSEHVKE